MNGARRDLPDFIGVGPPRTATTWMHRVLTGHVTLPQGIKETQFFAWNFARGLEWYRAHFRDALPGRPIGEFGAAYFDRPEARERIARCIPDCKIICTLREPVARLYSHYRQLRAEGWMRSPTLEQALVRHRRRRFPGNLIESSSYPVHLRGWIEKFGRENVLVLLNDDLEADPQCYLDRVCAFIGIPPIALDRSPVGREKVYAISRHRQPWSPRLARGGRKLRDALRRRRLYFITEGWTPVWRFLFEGGKEFPPLDPATEAELRAYFRPDVEALEEMLGRNLSAWKDGARPARPAARSSA